MTTHKEFVAEMAKASPPVAVAGLTVFGIPLNEVLIILTIGYTVLQTYFLLRDKWWKPRKAKHDSKYK